MGPLDNQDPTEATNVPPEDNILLLPLRLLFVASNEINIPYRALLIVAAFIGASVVGLISYETFRSVHIMFVVMIGASVFAILYGDGIWGWAIPVTFGSMTFLYVLYRRH